MPEDLSLIGKGVKGEKTLGYLHRGAAKTQTMYTLERIKERRLQDRKRKTGFTGRAKRTRLRIALERLSCLT